MNWKAKIAIGLVIALVAAAAVTGVAFLTTQQQVEAIEEPGLYLNGEKVADPGVMITVGDREFGFDEYRYYYMMSKSYVEQMYGADIWNQDYDGSMAIQLRQMTEENIVQACTWLKLAADAGITLSAEEKQEILDTMNKQKETLGEEGFAKNLREMFFTSEEMYLQITEEQKLVQKAQEQMKTQYTADIEANLDQYYITAKHILITPDAFSSNPPTAEEELLDAVGEQVAGSSTPDSGAQSTAGDPAASAASTASSEAASSAASSDAASVAGSDAASSTAAPELTEEEKDKAAKEFSQQLVQQLRYAQSMGQDVTALFDQFVQDYGMDPGVETNPDGYTFGEGEMVEPFYEGAKALEVGQISELVPTDYGYHIILRLPLNEEAIGGGDKATAIGQLASNMVTMEANAVKEGMEVGYGAYYQEVTPKNMH